MKAAFEQGANAVFPLTLWTYWHVGNVNLINHLSKDTDNNNDSIRSNRNSDNSSSPFHHTIRTYSAVRMINSG
jgi:hypothetical protein